MFSIVAFVTVSIIDNEPAIIILSVLQIILITLALLSMRQKRIEAAVNLGIIFAHFLALSFLFSLPYLSFSSVSGSFFSYPFAVLFILLAGFYSVRKYQIAATIIFNITYMVLHYHIIYLPFHNRAGAPFERFTFVVSAVMASVVAILVFSHNREVSGLQKELEERENTLSFIINNSNDLITLTKNYNITYASPSVYHIFGYSQEEFVSRTSFDVDIHPDDRERLRKKIAERMQNRDADPWTYLYRHRRKDGRYIWVETTAKSRRYDSEGNVYSVLNTRDVTKRQEAEQKLQRAYEENLVLLQEVHHRVKNNMQIISSMLNLSADRLEDPYAAQALRENTHRIQAMSLVHEMLYASEAMAYIHLFEYARSLASDLIQDEENFCNTHISVVGEELNSDIDYAIPFGLLLTELLFESARLCADAGSNLTATQEADAGSVAQPEKPEIVVELKTNEKSDGLHSKEGGKDTGLILTISLKPSAERKHVRVSDERKAESLSIELAESLVGQLEGTIHIDVAENVLFLAELPSP